MGESAWLWTLERRIPSHSGAGRAVVEEIVHHLEGEQWAPHDVFAVHLALEEAIANAIRHGNRLDGEKVVRITCRLAPQQIQVEVEDQGPGFQPQEVPDPTQTENLEIPSGRGILLIQNFMSRVCYNKRGNCVVMEKDRRPATEQAAT